MGEIADYGRMSPETLRALDMGCGETANKRVYYVSCPGLQMKKYPGATTLSNSALRQLCLAQRAKALREVLAAIDRLKGIVTDCSGNARDGAVVDAADLTVEIEEMLKEI